MSIGTWLLGMFPGTRSARASAGLSQRSEPASPREESASTASTAPSRIDRASSDEAAEYFKKFLPMFRHLNDIGASYCLIGGLAVMAYSLAYGSGFLRTTDDADIMFSDDFDNQDFARAYLRTYGADPSITARIYDEMFGDGVFDELGADEQALISCSFHGLRPERESPGTPDFDVVRYLNTLNFQDMQPRSIRLFGTDIPVASPDVLIFMKKSTVSYMVNVLHALPRERDRFDIEALERASRLLEGGDPPGPAGNISRGAR